MFGTIRKHQTWLWSVIITVIVISFVIYFSPYSKVNGGRSSGNFGSIDGEQISDRQFIDAERDVALHYFLRSGRWPSEDKRAGFDETAETYKWLVLVHKEIQLGIHASDEAAAEMARQLVSPFERMGIESPIMFVQKVLEPRGLQMADFERFVRRYVGIQEMIGTLGLSGELITPQESRLLYERQFQEMSTEAAFFEASNYLSKVTVTPEALSQYYSNRVANYGIPERVQVNYVRFNVTNFLHQAETDLSSNLTAIVEENFRRMGSNYFAGAKTPEEAKTKLREEIIRTQAMADARKKALEFATVLFDMKPARPENLRELASTNGVTAALTAPFDREEGPKDVPVGADFTKAAFSLTAEDPFAGPLKGEDGEYVIALGKRLPHETPSLDQIRDRVTADYKHSQALFLARQAAYAFSQTATNGIAQGKTFAQLCADAGVKAVTLSPFSISARSVPEVDDPAALDRLKQAAFGTPPGKTSPLVITSEGGMVLFVKAKLPLDKQKMETDLPKYLAALRRNRQEQAFNQWFSREYSKQLREGLRNTPVGQQQAVPPSMGSGAANS